MHALKERLFAGRLACHVPALCIRCVKWRCVSSVRGVLAWNPMQRVNLRACNSLIALHAPSYTLSCTVYICKQFK